MQLLKFRLLAHMINFQILTNSNACIIISRFFNKNLVKLVSKCFFSSHKVKNQK
jgi:hypothetical protein